MQPIRACHVVNILLLLLMLSACSGQAVKTRHQSTTPTPLQQPRDTVVVTAREMLGAPYRYGGTTPRGFDCSGLVWYSHQRAGISVPRSTRQQLKSVTPVSTASIRGGDLLFFRIDGRNSYHVGIYLGGGIHVFFNDWIALDLTVRNYMFSDNPSGLDFDADLAVTDDDNRFLNHLFMGAGLSFMLPTSVKRTP